MCPVRKRRPLFRARRNRTPWPIRSRRRPFCAPHRSTRPTTEWQGRAADRGNPPNVRHRQTPIQHSLASYHRPARTATDSSRPTRHIGRPRSRQTPCLLRGLMPSEKLQCNLQLYRVIASRAQPSVDRFEKINHCRSLRHVEKRSVAILAKTTYVRAIIGALLPELCSSQELPIVLYCCDVRDDSGGGTVGFSKICDADRSRAG